MMMYKLIALAFLFLTPIFGLALTRLLRLDRLKINFADLALPVYIFEINMVSQKFFPRSYLPYYLVVASLLAMIVAIGLFWKNKENFTYKRFLKIFWRTGFIMTFFFYLAVVIAVFIF
ncbi:DUF3397 family protein [Streptococcus plurextorum]|uniref:DUF3397 family protein n=1 Tax=Streptococcus plurextorum TaxID=456876 RepID=UPI0003FDDD19|nr:DUF3397 family protein [Streptococcus plurextorum]